MNEIKIPVYDLVFMLLGFLMLVGNLYIFLTVNEWVTVQHLVPSGDAGPALFISGSFGIIGLVILGTAVISIFAHNE